MEVLALGMRLQGNAERGWMPAFLCSKHFMQALYMVVQGRKRGRVGRRISRLRSGKVQIAVRTGITIDSLRTCNSNSRF